MPSLAPTLVLLRAPAGDVYLEHAQIGELTERYDRSTFRAPFGTTHHAEGSGKLTAVQLPLKIRLRGATLADADTQLQQLETALRTATLIAAGSMQLPVLGAGGDITESPTLLGWNVTTTLLAATADWQPYNPTAGLLDFTVPDNAVYLGAV